MNANIQIADSTSNKAITLLMLREWRNSDIIRDMKTANNYYAVRNEGIVGKSRSYRDEDGRVIENPTLSNEKMANAFLRVSVDQKVDYAFGKPFLINVENATLTAGEKEQDANAEKYLSEWQRFITPGVRRSIKKIAKNAINNGIGWAYVWIDENGMLQITSVDSETLYPAWGDRDHTQLDVIVRDYTVTAYEGDTVKELQKVEYWDAEVVERYIYGNNGLVPDTTDIDFSSHMTMPVDGVTKGVSWGRVPFIALKGSDDELPLLNRVRSLIDAYDKLQSKSTDGLLDDVDPVVVLKNTSAEVGGLLRTRELLKTCRIAVLGEDGDASYLQVHPDISAVQQKMEHIKKDIREFSASVDTQDVKFGSNPSGVALRAMYQDLDICINALETEFEVFIESLKYFFDIWLEYRGVGTVGQWADYRVIATLDRDMMINDSENLDGAVKLLAIGASQETVFSYAPGIESAETEMARLDAQRQREREEEKSQGEMFLFEKNVSESSDE